MGRFWVMKVDENEQYLMENEIINQIQLRILFRISFFLML